MIIAGDKDKETLLSGGLRDPENNTNPKPPPPPQYNKENTKK